MVVDEVHLCLADVLIVDGASVLPDEVGNAIGSGPKGITAGDKSFGIRLLVEGAISFAVVIKRIAQPRERNTAGEHAGATAQDKGAVTFPVIAETKTGGQLYL